MKCCPQLPGALCPAQLSPKPEALIQSIHTSFSNGVGTGQAGSSQYQKQERIKKLNLSWGKCNRVHECTVKPVNDLWSPLLWITHAWAPFLPSWTRHSDRLREGLGRLHTAQACSLGWTGGTHAGDDTIQSPGGHGGRPRIRTGKLWSPGRMGNGP